MRLLFAASMVFGFVALLSASGARATSFVERPFPEYVQRAPIIVRGKVGMSYSDWATALDHVKRIYTYTQLDIDEVLKGDLQGRSVVMRELGGEKDGLGMQVSGTARFERGEDVVVMLGERNPDGSRDVQGMMMGKYDIERDDRGQEILDGPGLGLHGRSSGTWSLDRLRQLIRKQAAHPQTSAAPSAAASEPMSAEAHESAPANAGSASPAPQLQPASPGAPQRGGIWAVAAVIAAACAFLLLRRSKR